MISNSYSDYLLSSFSATTATGMSRCFKIIKFSQYGIFAVVGCRQLSDLTYRSQRQADRCFHARLADARIPCRYVLNAVLRCLNQDLQDLGIFRMAGDRWQMARPLCAIW